MFVLMGIAGLAEGLQIADIVGSALGEGNDVVNLQGATARRLAAALTLMAVPLQHISTHRCWNLDPRRFTHGQADRLTGGSIRECHLRMIPADQAQIPAATAIFHVAKSAPVLRSQPQPPHLQLNALSCSELHNHKLLELEWSHGKDLLSLQSKRHQYYQDFDNQSPLFYPLKRK